MSPQLLSILACPNCHGTLEESEGGGVSSAAADPGLVCLQCGTWYPVRGGLPILLSSEGVDAGHNASGGPPRSAAAASSNGDANLADQGSVLPARLVRAGNVLGTQGVGPFVQKAWRAARTEAERSVPVLRRGPVFECPCCGERGRFLSYRGRPYAQCPDCGSKERDRLLMLVLQEVLERHRPRSVVHASPETTIRPFLAERVESYVAVDLTHGLSSYAGRLTAAADLTRLPVASDSVDLVVASHVLEHIPDDRAAIREIHRVLGPGGVAILPVPIVHDGTTVEYDAPRPDEEMHVRAPGLDYFDRFREVGFEVSERNSSDFPTAYQVRSHHAHFEVGERANGAKPGTPGSAGMEQHVPVCVKR